MPRKDGVRGHSKKKDSYTNRNYRHNRPEAEKGGKKTSKRLRVKREIDEDRGVPDGMWGS